MAIVFSMGQIAKLLKHFKMEPTGRKKVLYSGYGKDGIYRTCKFDYHKDRDDVAKGTADQIAESLGFKNCAEMKKYIDENL